MAQETPDQTPEGRMIEAAAKASGQSVRTLAAKAGISDTRWRHYVKGWQPVPGGGRAAVRPPASSLARIAFVLGLRPEQLEEADRADAVTELRRLLGDRLSSEFTEAAPLARGSFSHRTEVRPSSDVDAIELIYKSSMGPREKLEAIRMVLQLSAEAEAQEAAQAGERQDEQPQGDVSRAPR